jgi:hypothetical protein
MSVCVNHPNETATARCLSCHKPICGDCAVHSAGSVFCSQACAAGAARFKERFRPYTGPGLLARIRGLIAWLFGLAVLLAVVAAVCAYGLKLPFFVQLLKKFGL